MERENTSLLKQLVERGMSLIMRRKSKRELIELYDKINKMATQLKGTKKYLRNGNTNRFDFYIFH